MLRAAKGPSAGDKVVKAAMDKLTKNVASKFAAQQASALAICSGPIAPVIGAMTGAAMNKATMVSTEFAIEYFQEDSRVIPESEWKLDLATSVGKVRMLDAAMQKAYSQVDDKLDFTGKAAKAMDVAAIQARAAAGMVDEKYDVGVKVASARQAGKQKTKDLVYKTQDRVIDKFSSKMDGIADKMILNLNNQLALPKFMRHIVDQLIRDIVLEIQAEGVYHIESILAHHEADKPESPDRLKEINCLQRLRGWILYHWMPYDHSSFYKMGDPVWIFLKLLAVMPMGGMFFFYLILWLLIDKSNTFQLVKFIVDFKGLQAISLGIGCIFIGATKYVRCANQVDDEGNLRPNCDEKGPGAGDAFWFGFMGWIGCVGLVWLTFLILRCAPDDHDEMRSTPVCVHCPSCEPASLAFVYLNQALLRSNTFCVRLCWSIPRYCSRYRHLPRTTLLLLFCHRRSG